MPQPYMIAPTTHRQPVYPDHLGMVFYSSVHNTSHFYPDTWSAYAEADLDGIWHGSIRYRNLAGKFVGFKISAGNLQSWEKEARFLLCRGARQ